MKQTSGILGSMHKFQPKRYYAVVEISPINDAISQTATQLDKLMNEIKFFKQEGWIYSGSTECLLPELLQTLKNHIASEASAAPEWRFKAVALYELKDDQSDG